MSVAHRLARQELAMAASLLVEKPAESLRHIYNASNILTFVDMAGTRIDAVLLKNFCSPQVIEQKNLLGGPTNAVS